jgi:hypothetical protein
MQLTACKTALLEKLTVSQMVKKSPFPLLMEADGPLPRQKKEPQSTLVPIHSQINPVNTASYLRILL